MTGDPVTPFLVENWSKGLLAGHEQQVYAALRRNATGTPPAELALQRPQRQPLVHEARLHPVRVDLPDPYKGGDNDCQHPASATLEYAAADAALSHDGRGPRAQAPTRGMFAGARPELPQPLGRLDRALPPAHGDGAWMDPYDPATGDDQFHESGAYQYQWLVPQDPEG